MQLGFEHNANTYTREIKAKNISPFKEEKLESSRGGPAQTTSQHTTRHSVFLLSVICCVMWWGGQLYISQSEWDYNFRKDVCEESVRLHYVPTVALSRQIQCGKMVDVSASGDCM